VQLSSLPVLLIHGLCRATISTMCSMLLLSNIGVPQGHVSGKTRAISLIFKACLFFFPACFFL